MATGTVELSEELHRQIAELARQTGRSEADLLDEAIASYVASRRTPRPKSDAAIDAPDIAARDTNDWPEVARRPD